MWVQVKDAQLPLDLAAVTTSLWEYNGLARVGVIRGSTFLVPPYLWAEVYHANFRALRNAGKWLTELQTSLHHQVVFAETDATRPDDATFLRFIGFEQINAGETRNLFKRSIF